MIPLAPTLALAFLSFTCSVFVILRIVIPILPPHPLSRRVAPSEFGLPNFKKLAPSDKTHLWIAACDVLALVVFIWQVIAESLGGPTDYAAGLDPLAAIRLWFASTIRATCVLVIIAMTLLHVRLARPVDFGKSHWLIWAPGLLLIITSTTVAGVLAGSNFPSLFIGMIAYSSSLTFLGVAVLAGLVGTLVAIRRNLTSTAEPDDSWPPMRQVDDKRHSFAQEDIDVLKDGSSWITSDAGSHHGGSISAFSFSTHHTHARKSSNSSSNLHHGSTTPKSTFWFNPEAPGRISPVPPVPPLPAPYRPASPASMNACDDPDPFRRTVGNDPRVRNGSQASWLTEPSIAPSTATAWSFPATRPASRPNTPGMFPQSTADLHAELLRPAVPSRPQTPAISSAQVLGGYGFSDVSLAERQAGLAAVPEGDLDTNIPRVMTWFITVLLPCAFSLPYFVSIHLTGTASTAASVLMILAITLPSPLLALAVLFHWSLLVPSGLFESTAQPMPELARTSSPTIVRPWSHEYKRSGSVTVVEGRRSGDVWLTNGDAIDGKNKIGRAFEMLNAKPKLSVLPLDNAVVKTIDGELTPPLPLQSAPNSVPHTPVSVNSEEFGKKKSKTSSQYSSADETALHTARVMVAQKHYSTLAMTMVVPPSPDPEGKPFATSPKEVEATGIASGVAVYESAGGRSHCRTRSTSSVSTSRSRNVISPPPAFPLPPTPPSVKAARAMVHKRSYSSGISMTEIDALSAGILPNLVPGLKIGEGVKISDEWRLSSASHIRGSMTGKTFGDFVAGLPKELGESPGEFSSPEFHSTPATNGKKVGQRAKKASHKKHHFSLPSLSLGKDGIHGLTTWRAEVNKGLEAPAQDERRNTVVGEQRPETTLDVVREVDELSRPSSPLCTQDPATARSSMATLINALDNEFKFGLFGIDEDISLDFDASGPLAHSTPHESHKPVSRSPVPPMPKTKTTKANRRSSIVYIKSDENAVPPSNVTNENATRKSLSPTKRLAEISSRAMKPLMPKNKRKTSKNENASSTTNTTAIAALLGNGKDVLTASPGGGLRPLSLLQDRDVNRSAQPKLGVVAEDSYTRPLDLKKKQKNVTESRALANGVVAGKDENENVHAIRLVSGAASKQQGLKPLKLGRSETSKQRAVLRQTEVLPSVVVRPPSGTHRSLVADYQTGFN